MLRLIGSRMMFFLCTILVFVVVFPVASAPLLCLAVFTIPLVYLYLVVPAAVAGALFAVLVIGFKKHISLGSRRACALGVLVGSACHYAWIAHFGLDRTLLSIMLRDLNTAGDAALNLILLAILGTVVPFMVAAGGLCAALIRSDMFGELIGQAPQGSGNPGAN